ncbi:MAG: DUF4249 family protein, partial [Bacteroidia bacterium]
MKKSIFFLGIIVSLFSSCTKEIDIDLNSSNPQLVIEGVVTDETGPYTVKLSKTINFSDDNNYPPVTGAFVAIADLTAGITDTLDEVMPGIYQTSNLIGTELHTYQLTVIAESKTYTARSTMPSKINLDSLRFNTLALPGVNDALAVIPMFTDPILLGDNYRFVVTVNGDKDDSYILGNDNVSNGEVNQRPLISRTISIASGDTVSVDMRCLDLSTYTYFFTLAQISGNGPGGGTTP